ncbi:diguanylate cyclase [Roseiconus lacunae]|uniref:diguanylate cyclase n=1 Tax=Roseiconus lacunae TaxID=2605694 RepID=UPI0011F20DBB|nr:GGDEF domain-containing protein [Roseiconus lacunae]
MSDRPSSKHHRPDPFSVQESYRPTAERACLVQIYPADVVDGMMLIESERYLIGRHDDCDLQVNDPSVDERHACLFRKENAYCLIDLETTNGTIVNDRSIDQTALRSGDTIRIGTFIFKYLSADSVESKYHETLYSALTRDALTGTMNRRYLVETLDRSIATANRQQSCLAIAMVDIDYFKQINDRFGHVVGDAVLREFGQRLLATCRPDDLVARYGGEEFGLLLLGTNPEEATEITHACWHAIRRTPFHTSHAALQVTASFGIACFNPAAPVSRQELLRQADEKLYEAKRSGRNQICGPNQRLPIEHDPETPM